MSRSIRLEQVHIPEPCTADWSAMTGDDRTRFCQACDKRVHDLSARSRAEGEALLSRSDGNLCVQMTLDYQGRPITRDGWRAGLIARWVWPAASAVVALTLALLGCRRQQPAVVAGGMRAPPSQIQLAGTPCVIMGDVGPPPSTQPATQPTTQPAVTMGALAPPGPPATQATLRGEIALPATTPSGDGDHD